MHEISENSYLSQISNRTEHEHEPAESEPPVGRWPAAIVKARARTKNSKILFIDAHCMIYVLLAL